MESSPSIYETPVPCNDSPVNAISKQEHMPLATGDGHILFVHAGLFKWFYIDGGEVPTPVLAHNHKVAYLNYLITHPRKHRYFQNRLESGPVRPVSVLTWSARTAP
ncbi:hypothetical protein PanWU01x14_131290 [Parasponia andersonii]|uniref:Uncharacterized protein n=1 Tax=Parasponia andersonii TaxID=3476 RepID=A0A2P5CR02_PARAD|nr:hypothetical protein PanWU01x14_131290 [Parasponia andersonii]